MADASKVTFRWTRHIEYGLVGRVMGLFLVPFGLLVVYAAGSDQAWFPCGIGVFMLALALPIILGPAVRVEPDKGGASVRAQPPLRDQQYCLGAFFLVYGMFLFERAFFDGAVQTGYVVGGSVFMVVAAFLIRLRLRLPGHFVISQTQIVVPGRFTFSIDNDTASIQWGNRSDDIVILTKLSPDGKTSRIGLPYRLWGIHPNTVLSMIEQLHQWNSESRVVDGRVIAAMAVVPNQESVRKGESVDISILGRGV